MAEVSPFMNGFRTAVTEMDPTGDDWAPTIHCLKEGHTQAVVMLSEFSPNTKEERLTMAMMVPALCGSDQIVLLMDSMMRKIDDPEEVERFDRGETPRPVDDPRSVDCLIVVDVKPETAVVEMQTYHREDDGVIRWDDHEVITEFSSWQVDAARRAFSAPTELVASLRSEPMKVFHWLYEREIRVAIEGHAADQIIPGWMESGEGEVFSV